MLPLECIESNSQLVVLVCDQSYYLLRFGMTYCCNISVK